MRVLVVEDETRMARLLKRGLEEEGHAVDIAADGPEGLWLATENDYAAIVLDVMLPGFDGFELCGRLRAAGVWVPVLMLTARDSVADRVRGLDVGADDYLCKPFAFDELLARVRALVRRRDRAADLTLAHGDVSVDLVAQRARRAGQVLDLTAKELALLTFFLRHPGQVLSRTRIYDHVWDESFDGLSNTLEVHVMELRRKLEAHGPRLIHTLRGRGYLFGDPPDGPQGEEQ